MADAQALTVVKSEPLPTLTVADAPYQGPHPEAKIWPAIPGTALPDTMQGTLAYIDPARGAISPEARQKLNTPLVHTNASWIDNMTTPANLIATGVVGVGAATETGPSATLLARARAVLGNVPAQLAPQIKYQIVKSVLDAAHIPSGLSMAAAFAVSGVKRGSAPEAAPSSEAPTTETPVDISQVTAANRAARAARFGTDLTPEQQAAQAAVHQAPVALEVPIPTRGMPDVRASSTEPTASQRAETASAANPRGRVSLTDLPESWQQSLNAQLSKMSQGDAVKYLQDRGLSLGEATRYVYNVRAQAGVK